MHLFHTCFLTSNVGPRRCVLSCYDKYICTLNLICKFNQQCFLPRFLMLKQFFKQNFSKLGGGGRSSCTKMIALGWKCSQLTRKSIFCTNFTKSVAPIFQSAAANFVTLPTSMCDTKQPYCKTIFLALCLLYSLIHITGAGFFPWRGDWGVPPHLAKILPIPPHLTLVPVFGPCKACPPPPPAEVRHRKFEKFKYIFVSNLTTFKLKSTLKSCISGLK